MGDNRNSGRDPFRSLSPNPSYGGRGAAAPAEDLLEYLLKGFSVPLTHEDAMELSPNFPAIRSESEGCVKVTTNPFSEVKPSVLVGPETDVARRLAAALRAERAYDGAALVAAAPPGIYTWLMYVPREGGDRRFVAKQTMSMWELGTRHGAICCDPDLHILPENNEEDAEKGVVVGGGELEKTAAGIRFNLLSGTFTKVMMDSFVRKTFKEKVPDYNRDESSRKRVGTGIDYVAAYTDAIVGEVRRLVSPGLAFVPTVVDGMQAATFLTYQAVGPVSAASLARYKATGFVIGSAAEDECVECEAAADAKVAAMRGAALARRAPRPPNSPMGGAGAGGAAGGAGGNAPKTPRRRRSRRRQRRQTRRRR